MKSFPLKVSSQGQSCTGGDDGGLYARLLLQTQDSTITLPYKTITRLQDNLTPNRADMRSPLFRRPVTLLSRFCNACISSSSLPRPPFSRLDTTPLTWQLL